MRRSRRGRSPPAPTPDAALFLDVDGTLLDIAPTPDAVIVPEGLIETLRRLDDALGGAVALVSGRQRAELRRLFRGTGVVLIGEHGAAASVAVPALAPGLGEGPPRALVAALRRFAAGHPDTVVERKRHGAALHVRRAPAAAAAARRLAAALAEAHGDRVRLLRGKAVFEFVACGVSKGRAIEMLLRQEPFRHRVPYVIGDDVTDEDGFAVANRKGGTSLRVRSAELREAGSAACFAIASPSHLRRWLREVADKLLPAAPNRRARNQARARSS